MQEQLEQYILRHIDPEPELLWRLDRETHLSNTYPHMCAGHLQGRILKMFTRMIHPHRILELGTFTGYSALCFAEGMPSDAELHTIELNDELADFITSWFKASFYKERIHLHIGDAMNIVPTLGWDFDLVFIDANKRNYSDYYQLVLPRVKSGGFIIADNTLWDGKVAAIDKPHDAKSQGILAFNDLVATGPLVERVILPIRDGLTIIHKL